MNNKVFKENLTSKLLKIESLKILNKLKKKVFWPIPKFFKENIVLFDKLLKKK
tara:strand:+ start:2720 stop:2878 length:159 start_codon:yes stop_codon:yes gene_type:complete